MFICWWKRKEKIHFIGDTEKRELRGRYLCLFSVEHITEAVDCSEVYKKFGRQKEEKS